MDIYFLYRMQHGTSVGGYNILNDIANECSKIGSVKIYEYISKESELKSYLKLVIIKIIYYFNIVLNKKKHEKKKHISISFYAGILYLSKIKKNEKLIILSTLKDVILANKLFGNKLRIVYYCQHTEFWDESLFEFKKALIISEKIICVSHYLHNLVNNMVDDKGKVCYMENHSQYNNKINIQSVDDTRIYDYAFTLSHQWWKGFQDSINIIAEIKKLNIRANIICFGTLNCESAKKFLKENNVEFLGTINHDQVLALLRKSRTFIYTSFFEGYGLLAMEALRSGCLVYSYDNLGIRNLKSDNLKTFGFRGYKKMLSEIVNSNKTIELSPYISSQPTLCHNAMTLISFLTEK